MGLYGILYLVSVFTQFCLMKFSQSKIIKYQNKKQQFFKIRLSKQKWNDMLHNIHYELYEFYLLFNFRC